MGDILLLWAPILISAVIVFFASALAHMVLPHHKKDYITLPDEDGAMKYLADVPAGQYMFPNCHGVDLSSDEFKAKWAAGPHGLLRMYPRPHNMVRNLVLTFLFYILVGVFVAYICTLALVPDVETYTYLHVFQVAGTAAIMAYCFGGIPQAIWFGTTWGEFLGNLADGVVYGLLTAGVFGWLYPAASVASGTGGG